MIFTFVFDDGGRIEWVPVFETPEDGIKWIEARRGYIECRPQGPKDIATYQSIRMPISLNLRRIDNED